MFSIIIVTWKNWEQCDRCVKSIDKNSYYKTHEIIIVDNEALAAGVQAIPPYPFIMHFRENLGLSKAANEAAKRATKNYICLIDDDMEVLPNWDRGLLDARIKTGSNWVASTMIEPNPSSMNVSMKEFRKTQSVPNKWYINISNTPLLILRGFWHSIGGYDEDFPNVGAELGLAKRAYDHGVRKFIQTPFSMVYHYQSQSISRLKKIGNLRRNRDDTFLRKYGITRQEFIKTIGKGEVYDPSV